METTGSFRLGPRGTRWFDGLLAFGLAGFAALGYAAAAQPLELVLSVAQLAPLFWRRRYPGLVFLVVAVASAAQVPFDSNQPLVGQLAFPIAAYSVARWGGRVARWVALAVIMCAAVVAAWDWSHPWAESWRDYIAPALTSAALATTGWAFGVAGAQRDRFVASLLERAEEARRAGEREVALAAQDERARIAREMHDVVAHGLSVIVVQADGARYAAQKDPAVAVTTLETVAATGRSSLAEMRRLLGVLRTDDSGLRPQPTLADVSHLVSEARASGTVVEADLPEAWPEVPGGVGLTVYRVVQEALTNVRKHAGTGARVTLRVAVGPGYVDVEVLDDGHGAGADRPDGAGLGLVGMRERVLAHGGEVTSGPARGGGWRVAARIPL